VRRSIAIVMLLVLALVGTACGGDEPEPLSEPTTPLETTAPTATETPDADCEDQSGEDITSLEMTDNQFEPACLTSSTSSGLHLENNGTNPHTFTIDDSEIDFTVQPGQETNVDGPAPIQAGEYTFYCKFHGSPSGGMSGTITFV
jgi:plastocyanin